MPVPEKVPDQIKFRSAETRYVGSVTDPPPEHPIIDPQSKKMAVLIAAPPSPAAVGMGVSPVLPGPEQPSLISTIFSAPSGNSAYFHSFLANAVQGPQLVLRARLNLAFTMAKSLK